MRMPILMLILFMLSSQVFASADPAIGKTKAIICFGCHGVDGNNNNSDYPILAGQGADYLSKQLFDFKTGARKEEHMSSMVEAISKSDIPHIAAYFSGHQRKVIIQSNSINGIGRVIFLKGITSKKITACSQCHGADGQGNVQLLFPSIAGQHTAYLIKILKEFRSGTRHNDSQQLMRNIAKNLSDQEIKAVSEFISKIN